MSQRSGVLLIDKPLGPSSFDMVRLVRRKLGLKKVGHTGTLDPMASGLMVLCLGDATRVVPYLTAEDKAYIAEITLGQVSETYDAEGTVERSADAAALLRISTADIEEALTSFLGWIEQRPPMFSAIKVNGERAYAKARRGEVLDLPTRPVRIDQCKLVSRDGPLVSLSVACSKGTYIRSIAHDLGERLGVGAVLSALRRVRVGGMSVDEALTANELEESSTDAIFGRLVRIEDALKSFPRIILGEQEAQKITFGQSLTSLNYPASTFLAFGPSGRLLAIMDGRDSQGKSKILRGFPTV